MSRSEKSKRADAQSRSDDTFGQRYRESGLTLAEAEKRAWGQGYGRPSAAAPPPERAPEAAPQASRKGPRRPSDEHTPEKARRPSLPDKDARGKH